MSYEHFVKKQQHALIREFFDDPANSWIVVPRLEEFEKRYFGAGAIQLLPNVAIRDALAYRGREGIELWVRPVDKTVEGDSGYRSHWTRFVAEYGSGAVSTTLNGHAMVIDHLHPETAAARHGFGEGYVRVMPVQARGNSTVGSTIEKHLASRQKPSTSYLTNWFTVAKVSGFRASFRAAVPPATVMAALRDHLCAMGFELPRGQAQLAPETMEAILNWSRGVPTNPLNGSQ